MVLSGTDAGFEVDEEINYWAYGEQINVQTPTSDDPARETFTSKEFDQEGAGEKNVCQVTYVVEVDDHHSNTGIYDRCEIVIEVSSVPILVE